MTPVWETDEFRVGKQVTKGRPTPTEPFHPTIVSGDDINDFLGVGSVEERVAHLKGVRDLGVLVHNRRRLTQNVRLSDGRRRRAYVFRGTADSIPRRRRARRPKQRILRW